MDERAKENPTVVEAGLVSTFTTVEMTEENKPLNTQKFSTSGCKNIGIVVPAAKPSDFAETAQSQGVSKPEPETAPAPEAELNLEEQAKLRRQQRQAEGNAEGKTEEIPPDRLLMMLRPIVRRTRDNAIARHAQVKEFHKAHDLPKSVVRDTVRQLDAEFDTLEREREKTEKADDKSKRPQSLIQFRVTSKGTPKAIVFNALQVLRYDSRWQGVLGYDQFAERAMLLKRPPYDRSKKEWTPRPIEDSDDIESADWMQGEFDLPVSSGMTAEAIQVAARYNRFHPIRDYLDSLVWDGIPRLDTWLIIYFGAVDNEYTRAVGSKSMISAVARIYRPGCKVDTVLILDGPQGFLKSTAWRVLAGDDWFTDHMPDLHSKDAMQQLAGKWIIELAELAALSRSDVEATKRFISAVQDDFRPSYGRRRVTLPRQCIFTGTTNETCYLKDSTGNRRFWPVSVTRRCNIAKLREERDQLWAEAVHRFYQGERWHLTGHLEQQAAEEQTARIEPDEWETLIMQYLHDRSDIHFVTSGEILGDVLGIDKKDWVLIAQKRVASIMRSNGWKHFGKRIDGVKTKGFLRPIPQPSTPPSSRAGTDGTDTDSHGTDSDNVESTENCSKNNGGTDGTDGTGTYIDRQQQKVVYYRQNDRDSTAPAQNNRQDTMLRFNKTVGSTGSTGSTWHDIDSIGVFEAIPGTGTSTGSTITTGTDSDANNTGSTSYAAEEPPNLGDGFMDAPAESFRPGAAAMPLKPEPELIMLPAQAPKPDCRNCLRHAPHAYTCRAFSVYCDPMLEPLCGGKYFEPVEVQS